ncbi:MAG: hypothetical protein AVO38_10630 [delta proteobacterium ML8_D]|nr:MAG: hypothetical protein AVO38_10630 [delta proteobacterium ML8_D]
MIIGSKQFINKIRSTYLPEKPHKEIPQQRELARGVDLEVKLKEATRILDCDLDHFRRSPRISKAERDDRDLLVFSVWKTGILTNEKIGRLFGMTYSSISHIIRSLRLRMDENRDLKEKFNQVYSLFKN